MKTSIALAAYNGEEFIEKQLLSFLNQTRIVDEVIIFDDCSTDRTVKLINSFIKQNRLVNWKLYVNSSNVGWRRNFMNAVDNTTGDIIFFADQDDVWPEDRVAIMVKTMNENDCILALGGYRVVIDRSDKPTFGVQPIAKDTKHITHIPFNNRNCFLIQSGCISAFRRIIYHHMKNLWISGLPHDVLLWRIACILDGAYKIDYTVLRYRLHSSNTSGVSQNNYIGKRDIYGRIAAIQLEYDWTRNFLLYFSNIPLIDKELKLLVIKNGLEFLKNRINFLISKSILSGLKLFGYLDTYQSISQYIGDLMYACNLHILGGNVFWYFRKKGSQIYREYIAGGRNI